MTPASNTSRLCAALLFGLCIVDEAAATSSRGVLAPPGIAPAPAVDLSPRTYELPEPLKPAERVLLLRTPGDPAPEVLAGVTEARVGQHYVTGNEHGLDAFRERVRGLGGGYLGVGAEQGYLLLGWSRAELGWLIDYDPVVVETHALHHAIFLAADTPERYLELWHKLHMQAAQVPCFLTDERSVVLRTLLTWEHNRDYRYNAQPLPNYRRWLAHASVRTLHDVVRLDRLAADARGFFEVRELPDLVLLQRRELRRRKLEAAAAATAAAP